MREKGEREGWKAKREKEVEKELARTEQGRLMTKKGVGGGKRVREREEVIQAEKESRPLKMLHTQLLRQQNGVSVLLRHQSHHVSLH